MLAVEAMALVLQSRGRPALGPLDFRVDAGERLAVFGPAGAGKSTLLDLVAGDLEAASGAVRVLGRPPQPAARLVGHARQAYRATPSGAVQQVMARHAARASATPPPAAARIAEALDLCGLYDLRDRPARDLSTLERVLLEIACAIALRPAVLLLDDLTAALPPDRASAIHAHLDERRLRDGLALVHATACASDAELADRVLMLHAGRQIALDAPTRLLTASAADALIVEAADPAAVRRTLRGIFDVEIAETSDGLRFRAADGEMAAANLLRHPTGGVRTVYLRRPTLWDVHRALTTHPQPPRPA